MKVLEILKPFLIVLQSKLLTSVLLGLFCEQPPPPGTTFLLLNLLASAFNHFQTCTEGFENFESFKPGTKPKASRVPDH